MLQLRQPHSIDLQSFGQVDAETAQDGLVAYVPTKYQRGIGPAPEAQCRLQALPRSQPKRHTNEVRQREIFRRQSGIPCDEVR